MNIFKRIGVAVKAVAAVVGIQGKPAEWIPAVITIAGDIPAAKTELENKVKAAILPEIETARVAVILALRSGTPEREINAAFARFEAAVDRFQL